MVDHDPNQVEQLRRFGSKAYYGDATRLDLLEAAGARKAKLLVVAVDNPESAMQIVKLARRHFRTHRVKPEWSESGSTLMERDSNLSRRRTPLRY